MKYPLIGILLVMIITWGCGLRKKKEEESFQTPLEQYKDEDFYAYQRRSIDTGKMNLVLVRYQANYDNDFTPTINLYLQNTGVKTVTSFEIEANLGSSRSFFSQCIYRRTFKQTIPPGQGIGLSYKVQQDNTRESCNDYPVVDVIREVCSDSTMNRKLQL